MKIDRRSKKGSPILGIGLVLLAVLFAILEPQISYGDIFPNEKYRNWTWDTNLNRIDDRLELIKNGGTTDAIVLFDHCITDEDITFLSTYATIKHVGTLVQGIQLENVLVSDLFDMLSTPQGEGIFRIEMHQYLYAGLDISCGAVRARRSAVYADHAWQDADGTGVNIAILDTGVDDGHPDLVNKYVTGYNAITTTVENPDDDNRFDENWNITNVFHGTHVAGIALGFNPANPNAPNIGVARGAGLVDVKIGDSQGSATWGAIEEGLRWCELNRVTHNIGVVNISFGTRDDGFGGPPRCNGKCAICMAVDGAVDAGLVVCAITQNGSFWNAIACPAAADRAIAVGAVNDRGTVRRNDDTHAGFSNAGPRRSDFDDDTIDEEKPDVVAPGVTIEAPEGTHPGQNPGNNYQNHSGTSQACPHVAGIAAILLELNPDLSPDDIKAILRRTSTDQAQTQNPAYTPDWGKGEVDAFGAICNDEPDADLYIKSWNYDEIFTPATPQINVTTQLTAKVRNRGSKDAFDVDIIFFTNKNNIGYDGWVRIGETTIDVPADDNPVKATIDWTPVAGKQCIRARAVYCGETNPGDNQGQVNFTPSQSYYVVEAGTPYVGPQNFRMVINSMGLLAENGWTAEIWSQEGLFDPFWIDERGFFEAEFLIEDDRCPKLIEVNINHPADAPPDAYSTIILEGWVDDIMVGQQTLLSYIEFLPTNWTIRIEKAHDVLQGHFVDISITTENRTNEMGGFDFLIAYDASALAFTEAEPGQLLEDCSWEYFTYRYGVDGNCGDACPSGLLRIVALAETNNGPLHPSCYGAPDTDPHELVKLTFFVTNDRTFDCQYIPIYFFWDDCNDNAISSIDGQTLYINRAVYDFEGNLIWDEDDDDLFPEDARIPFVGAPDYCLNDDPEKPSAIRNIEFVIGGVDNICSDSIDARGDINVNGVPNEIADAVMFTNYFISGLSAFGDHVEASIAASDVNADGIALSVADLVYLVRVITGDAPPYPKVTPYATEVSVSALVNHSAAAISTISSADIGAGYFVLEYSGLEPGEPQLINGASEMTLKYSNDGGVLKVLVYSMDKGVKIPAGTENIFAVPITGEGTIELTDVQLSDYYGNLLEVTVDKQAALPKAYALHQNYPNPFNATTTIIYELPDATHVTIAVFNVLGQKVTTLLDDQESAGVHSISWDGTDESGSTVSSGVYFYRLSTPGFTSEKKMVLMK